MEIFPKKLDQKNSKICEIKQFSHIYNIFEIQSDLTISILLSIICEKKIKHYSNIFRCSFYTFYGFWLGFNIYIFYSNDLTIPSIKM